MSRGPRRAGSGFGPWCRLALALAALAVLSGCGEDEVPRDVAGKTAGATTGDSERERSASGEAAGARGEPDPSAAAVLRGMYDRYASLQTFSSAGVLESRSIAAVERTPFRIRYRRPDRLLVEWNGLLSGRSVVWRDGTGVYTYVESLGQREKEPSLAMAIASAEESSAGVASVVPELVGGSFVMSPFGALDNLELEPDDVLEGVPCHVIAGSHSVRGDYRFWIGKDDRILYRLERRRVLAAQISGAAPGFAAQAGADDQTRTEVQVYRDIAVDGDIPDSEFNVKESG